MMLTPGQRARFAVVHVRSQSKEALERIGDVGFDLLGRHAVIKSGHDYHRHVNLGEQVDRHADHGDRADQRNDQADHQDEEGITQGELRHYWPPPFAPAFMSIMPPDSCMVSEAGVAARWG